MTPRLEAVMNEKRPKDLHFRKECGDYTCGAHASWNDGFRAAIAEAEVLVEALEMLVPLVEGYHDAGPEGEGWQSDELESALQKSAAALAKWNGGE
jgi:hypothetical protein